MDWYPSYTIISGVLEGAAPAGSLEGVPGFMLDNLNFSANAAYGIRQNTQNAPDDPLPKWNAAYGSNGDLVTDYIDDHNGATQVTLAEIEIPKPEDATYYKQTLAIRFSGTVTRYTSYGGTWDYFSYATYSFERRVYADPQSPFIVTDTWSRPGNVGAITFAKNIQTTEPVNRFASIREYIALGSFTANGSSYWGVFMYGYGENYSNSRKTTIGSLMALKTDILDNAFGKFEPKVKKDPNDEDDSDHGPGKGGGGGGGGEHRLPDEGVPVPGLPEYGAGGVNWLTVYKMTQFQINEFGQELIDPDVWTIVKSFFTDPLDAIVGITLIPCDAPGTRTKYPEVGGSVTGHKWANAYPVLNTEFVEVDCGNLLIDPYWDSAFDFDPFTKFSLFLPFVGFKPIKSDDIMGGNIGVKYHVNVMTGDCTAFVTRTAASDSIYGPMLPQVIGEYNGNCAIRVPIGRVSHDAAIDASMRLMATGLGMIGGAIAGQALGDPMNIGASQVSGQISGATMTAVNGMKQGIERSGSLGGSAGYMGNLKPFLIRTIPKQYLPDNYKQLNGYPANKGGTLNHYAGSGYQAIETIELDNLSAYDNEIDEIRTLLKGGVLV